MKLPVFATRNLRLKVLAVALATIMWSGVAYASNPPDSRTVTVHVPQAQGDVAPYILVHPIADQVVRVSGTREHLNAFNPAALVVTVNYRAITHTGLQPLALSVVNNDHDVAMDTPPTQVMAEVDHLDSRTVNVSVDISVQPPQGYVNVGASTTPSTVTVIGPQHELGSVQARVTVSLASQRTNFQKEETVVLLDRNGRAVGDIGMTIVGHPQGQSVLVTVAVTPSLTSRASAVLPRISGTPPVGHELATVVVNPPAVVLNGPQDLLNTLDSVVTQTISLAGVNGTATYTVRVLPPAGVTVFPTTVKVTVTVIAIPPPPPTPGLPTPTPTPSPTPTL